MLLPKLAALAAAAALLLSACDRDDEQLAPDPYTLAVRKAPAGTQYQLTDLYISPGSATEFYPVTSDRMLYLLPDSTFVATGAICYLGTPADGATTTGTYSFGAGKLRIDQSCGSNEATLNLELEGETLSLWYPNCTDGCAARYTRTQVTYDADSGDLCVPKCE